VLVGGGLGLWWHVRRKAAAAAAPATAAVEGLSPAEETRLRQLMATDGSSDTSSS
jgi:uncharacterized membrane protein